MVGAENETRELSLNFALNYVNSFNNNAFVEGKNPLVLVLCLLNGFPKVLSST